MNEHTFTQQIETAFQRLELFRQQTSDAWGSRQMLVAEDLKELSIILEELQVAGEELHQQNKELAAARQTLEAERRRYRDLFTFAPDGYLVTDAAGVIREANRAAATLFNRDRNLLRGKPLDLFIATEDRQTFHAILTRLQEGDVTRVEDRGLRLQPHVRLSFPATVTVAVAYDAEDRQTSLRWQLRDSTECKRVEEALRESEKRFRTVADFAHDWEYWLDPDGNLLYISPSCERITGYHPDEFLKNPGLLKAITYPADRERLGHHLVDELVESENYSEDFRIITRDGDVRWIGHVCQPVYDTNGTFLGRRASNRNISRRKQAAAALQRSIQRLEILHKLDQAILGTEPPETIAQTALNLLQQLIAYYRASVVVFNFDANEAIILATVHIAGKTGSPVDTALPLEMFGAIEELRSGRIRQVEDILALPQPSPLDHALRAEGVCAYLNAPLIAQGELLGTLNLGLDHPGLLAPEQVEIAREVANQLAVAIRQARLQEQVQRYTTELEQRVAERTADLQRERDFVSAIFDTTSALVVVTDRQGRIVRFNRTSEQISGYTFEEVRGQHFWDLFLPPEEIEPAKTVFEQLCAGRYPHEYEGYGVTRDGSRRLITWSHTVLLDEEGAVKYIISTGIDITERQQAEEALAEERNLMRALIDHLPDQMYVKDVESRFIVANNYCARIVGAAAPVDLIGKTDFDLHSRELAERYYADEQTLFQTGQPLINREEPVIDREKGTRRQILTTKIPFRDSQGRIVGLVGMGRDITEWKQAQEAYRTLVEQSLQGLAILQEYRFVFANSIFVQITGYPVDELTALSPNEIKAQIYPEDQVATWKRLQDRLAGEPIASPYEFRFVRKDGQVRWLEAYASRIEYREKPALQIAVIDITERKQAEESLRLFKAIVDSSTVAIAISDADGQMVYINRAHEELFGRSLDEARQLNYRDYYPPESVAVLNREVAPALVRGESWEGELDVFDANGRRFPLWERADSIRDADDNLLYGFGLMYDVTERKQTEQALRESEEKFRTLAEQSPNMVFINKQDRVKYANEECEKVTGYNRDEFYSPDFDFLSLIAPESKELIKANFGKHMKGEQVEPYEFALITKEGQRVAVILSTRLIDYEGEQAILGILTNITERKRAEEALTEERNLLRTLIDNLPDCIYVKDSESRFIIGNRTVAHLMGATTPDELIGKTDFDFYPQELAAQYYADEKAVIQSGQPLLNREEPVIDAAGIMRWHSTIKAPLRDQQGKVVGIVGMSRNITKRKQTDEEKAQLLGAVSQQSDQLRALTRRLAEVEEAERKQLARELHDQVGQNLTALGLNLNIIRAQISRASPEASLAQVRLADSLNLLEETTERIRDVMANLRPPVLDDYGLVAALRWYGQRFAAWTNFTITVEGEEPEPRLAASVENALFRIAQEALANAARHAQANQVRLTVEEDRRLVRLIIADDGLGFEPAVLIESTERRGWGLLTMAERAEAVGGRCWVESNPGQGTRVIVEIR